MRHNLNHRKMLLGVFLVLALILGASACGGDKDVAKQDIEQPKGGGAVLPGDFEARVPDVLTVYRNVDDHANPVKLCIEGIAFRSVSLTHAQYSGGLVRVPEWDDTCPGYDSSRQQFPTGSVVLTPDKKDK